MIKPITAIAIFLFFIISLKVFKDLYDYNIMSNSKPITAIAVFNGPTIKGTVKFTEDHNSGQVQIDVNLVGLKKNALHGFHVHESGDLTDKCESMCAHFNPFKKNHGCPGKKERHVGDLGNLKTDAKGNAQYSFYDDAIKLRGTKSNILGRGLIIHADPDDCGEGGMPDSLTTGHAGKRIACAIIGYSKDNFK
jgi:Cu-Zn family superoxide dismutase